MIRHIPFFLLLCAGMLLAACGAKGPEKKEDFVGYSGKVAQEAEMNFSKARVLWTRERGLAATESEVCADPKAAIELLDKAIKIEPLYAEALLRRGMAKSDLKDFAGAFDDLTLSLRLQPTAQAYAARGLVSVRAGNTKAARKDIEYSLELNDAQSQAWNYLGLADILDGRDDDACKSFSRACNNGDCSRFDILKKDGACK